MQARRHRKSVLGQRDRRLEQARPGKPAVPAMRLLQQPHHARDADRPAADHRIVEPERTAVLRGSDRASPRRGAVSRPSYASRRRVRASCTSMKPPPPMPDDCGSTRPSTSCTAIAASTARAALREHAIAGIDRQRICRRDHPVTRVHRRLVDPAGRMLGRVRTRLAERRGKRTRALRRNRRTQPIMGPHCRIMPWKRVFPIYPFTMSHTIAGPAAIALAAFVLILGRFVTSRVDILARYSIPHAVTGGLIAALAILLLHADRHRHRVRARAAAVSHARILCVDRPRRRRARGGARRQDAAHVPRLRRRRPRAAERRRHRGRARDGPERRCSGSSRAPWRCRAATVRPRHGARDSKAISA